MLGYISVQIQLTLLCNSNTPAVLSCTVEEHFRTRAFATCAEVSVTRMIDRIGCSSLFCFFSLFQRNTGLVDVTRGQLVGSTRISRVTGHCVHSEDAACSWSFRRFSPKEDRNDLQQSRPAARLLSRRKRHRPCPMSNHAAPAMPMEELVVWPVGKFLLNLKRIGSEERKKCWTILFLWFLGFFRFFYKE